MRVLLLLFLLFPLPNLANDDLRQRQSELRALQMQIQAISTALEKDQRNQQGLSQELQRSEKRLSSLRQAVRVLDRDVRQTQDRARRLEQEQAQLLSTLKSHRRALRGQVRAAYIIGRQSQTRMLLSQDDPARLARLQTYLQRFQQQQGTQIGAFQTTLRELEAKRDETTAALADLKQLQASRKQALQSIESQHRAREKTMQKLAEKLGEGGAELQRLREQQAQLESLIDALTQALQSRPWEPLHENFARNRGKLIRPADGRTLASFNQLKADGQSRWKGVWLAAEPGTPVRAVAAARVVYVGWMHRYGLLLVLDHGKGYFSLYGHNQAALKAVGDRVAAGDSIAEAGNTGGHAQTGVYLEIRKGRKAQNPSRWLLAKNP